MGSCCCTSNSTNPTVQPYSGDKYVLPKVIVVAQDAALLYLDPSPTIESINFGYKLKKKFPNLIQCDSDKRIYSQIEYMRERKVYLISVGPIRNESLRPMLSDPKVRAIYYCLEPINEDQHPASSKIKGFFDNEMELKKTIYYDLRSDEVY